jgi:integrase/recombinase XerD
MLDSAYIGLFQTYLAEEKRASKNTVSSYIRDITQFFTYIGTKEIDTVAEIGRSDIEHYIDWLTKSGKSTATVSRSVASLKCFFTYLKQKGQLHSSPEQLPDGQKPSKSCRRFSQAARSSAFGAAGMLAI